MITPNVKHWSKTVLYAGSVAKRLLARGVRTSCVARQQQGAPTSADEETPIFFRPDIHRLLLAMTNWDPEKVHRPSTYESIGSGAAKSDEEYRRLRKPQIELMTDEELSKNLEAAPQLTAQRLQMPPVLPERGEAAELLEEEPRLAGLLPRGQRIVFTDISISDSISARSRPIVARDSEGSLRAVDWTDRDRFLALYFPIQGQRLLTPAMFASHRLRPMLDADKHVYVLERACVQFEPDHPLFIQTRAAVYDHALDKQRLHLIDATRHFGPLLLHAVVNNREDLVVKHFLEVGRHRCLVWLVQLLDKVKQLDFSVLPEVQALVEMNLQMEEKQVGRETCVTILNGVRAMAHAARDGFYPIRISDATMQALEKELAKFRPVEECTDQEE